MKTSFNKIYLFLSTLLVAVFSPLFAATLPITIDNPGFENPVLSNGTSTNNFTGWSPYGDVFFSGAWNPSITDFTNEAPEGKNIGVVFRSPGLSGYSQTLQGAQGQFQADTTYDLKVKVGKCISASSYSYDGYIIQLVVNNVVIAQDDNSRTPSDGAFLVASIKYNYNAALHATLVGHPIEIRLLSKGLLTDPTPYDLVGFDDVQLTYETANPVAAHGGPYRLSQNDPLSLNGNASLPSSSASSITSYEWDLNSNDNGGVFNVNLTGATQSVPYATLTSTYGMVFGVNSIRLRVTDNLGQNAISTSTVTIYPLYTYIGPNTSNGNTERWNATASWNTATVPSGLVNVLIPPSKVVPCLSALTPEFTGNLTIGSSSQISFGWTTSSGIVYNALGTPGQTVITMNSGSSLNFRVGGTPIVPAIALAGNATVTLGSSTQTGAQASFNYPITGAYRFSLNGNGHGSCVANFNTPNTFNEIYTSGGPYVDGGVTIQGNAPGSLGTGNLTLTALGGGGNSGLLIINAENSIADGATLSMDGNSSTKITMNANDTIARLLINGAQMPAGTYGSSTSTATFKQTWIAGNGVLTVTDGQASYWDINGATAGAGGASPTGNWDASSALWTDSITGNSATSSWIAGKNAVFAAGSDATGPYTVSVGGSNAITVTNTFTASANTGTSSFNVTRSGWALNQGNCVAIMISSLNATSFTATYAGQNMTVVKIPGVYDTRNSYVGIAYIISDSLPATGDVVISVPRDMPAINTGAYGNMGTVYSILSLSNVASAGTAVTRVQASGNASMTYSTSVNNSFVLGIGSDSNWNNSLKSVVGTCNQIISRAKPAYYNTIQCYGFTGAAGSYTDVYSPSLTALITLPFNAKTTSNPLLSGAGQKISGLGFEEGNVTITSSKLEMQNTSFINSASGVTSTIASQITGLSSSGLTKKGLGTLILSNPTNNYTGPTSIINGTLRLGASTSLPNTSVSISGDAPGVIATLDLNGYNNTVAGLTFGGASTTSGSSVTTGAGTLTLSSNVTYSSQNSPLGSTLSGNLSLGASTRTFNIGDSSSAANDLTVSAVTSGTGGLTKIGFGTLLLSGNNTYTGVTTVTSGLLVLSGSDNSAATGGITVNDSGEIRFESLGSINGTGQNVTIQSGGVAYFASSFGGANISNALARIHPSSAGVIAVDNFSSTAFNFSTNSLNVYLGALSDISYTGAITPFGGTYRIGGGTGTIKLTGENALTGGNNLFVGGPVVIANSNNLSGTTTINPSGRLQIGAGGILGSISSSSITNNGMLAFNRSDILTQGTHFWTTIGGTGTLEQAGFGTLILNGNNTYTGGTNLVGGTLLLNHVNAIGSGSLNIYSGTLNAASALTLTTNNAITLSGSFNFGGTENLNMGTGNVSNTGNHTISLNGTNKTLTLGGVMTNISGGDQTITANGSGNNLVLGGLNMSSDIYSFLMHITIGGTGNVSITGTVNDWSYEDEYTADFRLGTLNKTGSGTLTLSGNNNYTGNTVVAGGVLHLLNPPPLPTPPSAPPASQKSHIIVNNGGILAFTLGNTFNSNTITSTERLTLNVGHMIRIVGTVDTNLPYYSIMIAESIVGGLPTLETPISGYFLEIAGNELRLTKADITPPVMLDIVNDKGAGATVGPIPPNTLVTYTVTYNEDINDETVTAADFVNAGTSAITIGAITEISPGVFTVEVTPGVGTLQLRIPISAVISDVAENDLVVPLPDGITDETVINVDVPSNNWLVSTDIIDDKEGAPISPGTLITYTLFFNRDIDHTTVTAVDFDTIGTATRAPITNDDIAEIAPGIFTVKVTPTGLGTLQLRIPTTAVISADSSNLTVDPAIVDDTTIQVVDAFGSWAGSGENRNFNDDLNSDGVANGLAWLLGATDPNQNSRHLLPTADEVSGDLFLNFITLDTVTRGNASIKVQYSNDLENGVSWVNNQGEVPNTSSTVNGIVFDIQPLGEGYISVEARIPASAAGSSKKLFGRLIGSAEP